MVFGGYERFETCGRFDSRCRGVADDLGLFVGAEVGLLQVPRTAGTIA